MATKKKSFFQNVARVVTGKTAEQRQKEAQQKATERKANQVAMQIAKQKELASYRREKVAQAGRIGQAKAKYEVEQRIKAVRNPKQQSGGLNIGNWGKVQEGFDPLTFGTTQAKKSTSHIPSPMQVANMQFTDYTKPQVKTQVKRKLKRKRRKKK